MKQPPIQAIQITPQEQEELAKLLKNGISIPAQPKVMIELDRLLAQPQANISAIAKLVSHDPSLTAIIFRIIGSPIYGLRKPIESVEKAISVIGLTQMANIIKSAAIRKTLGGSAPFYEWFWERSGEIAQLCSIIAYKQRMVCNIFPDQAQLAGLFHDCGVPILMQRFSNYCMPFRMEVSRKWPNVIEEDRLLNTDHAVVGYLIARHWNLPDFICQAVRFHHEILHTEHKAMTMVAILQMARHIYNINTGNNDAEWEIDKVRVLEEIGVSEEGLKEFEEDIYDTLKNQ
jgi:HD-like signal output (HDOD) protein